MRDLPLVRGAEAKQLCNGRLLWAACKWSVTKGSINAFVTAQAATTV